MILIVFAVIGTALAIVPTAMFLGNISLFRHAILQTRGSVAGGNVIGRRGTPTISVLIPARDEERGIERSIESALASREVTVEVIVLDDHSSDRTAQLVSAIGERDPRVRCVSGKPLPQGWNGKQYACAQLAEAASHERVVFLDADVHLRPEGLATLASYQDSQGPSLLSAFPHQVTGTWLEAWLIPMMHFVLLGFLPMQRMRRSSHPAYAAGCGQLFMTRLESYRRAGTHAAIAASRHDGVTLPRAYRIAGMVTDVVDGTELADCRMYRSAQEVIRGALKNAIEGVANPRVILPFTLVLLGGAFLPWITLILGVIAASAGTVMLSLLAIAISYIPRAVGVVCFRQSLLGALFHPAATTLFVALQWLALFNHWTGRQIAWRGRTESTSG